MFDLYVTVNGDTTVVPGTDLVRAGGADVLVLDVAAKNMRETYTIVVKEKNNGNAVSPTYFLSIEGGAKSFLDKGQYQDLLPAMMKYGDSAADYFKK